MEDSRFLQEETFNETSASWLRSLLIILLIGFLVALSGFVLWVVLTPLKGIILLFIMSIVESGSFEALPIIILLFVIIQIIDVTLIQPTVVAKSVDLHPLIIIFTVFAGGTFLGVIWNVVCRVACRNYKSYHH